MPLLIAASFLFAYGMVIAIAAIFQRELLYFPTHSDAHRFAAGSGMVPWSENGQYIGWHRPGSPDGEIWLFCHGNGGQASDRTYAIPHFPEGSHIYILEYPGYGTRPGKPNRNSIDTATREAWEALLRKYPDREISAAGESLGSGPASLLAQHRTPPSTIVLIVPFRSLEGLAKEAYPWLPIKWLLMDRWDNENTLVDYKGRLVIWGAKDDLVIPVRHARELAQALPRAQYFEVDGGHNWPDNPHIQFPSPPETYSGTR